MSARTRPRRARRLEGRLRTGGAAHLVGGSLDLAAAFARWLGLRARARIRARARARRERSSPPPRRRRRET